MKYITHSEGETAQLAGRLAGALRRGDSVLLHGGLGAGKSVFARGVARGLGVQGAMPSPTFTLLIPHEGAQARLYHFDLYRLSDPDEFYEAGLDEFVGGDGIALIEWPEMAEIDPSPALHVYLRRVDEDTQAREIEIEGDAAPDWAERLKDWRRDE